MTLGSSEWKPWVLNQADGTNTLLEIADRSEMPFDQMLTAAGTLYEAGLLEELNDR